jgi:serine/threonine-protein kinase
VPDILDRLAVALADRYRVLRELGAGGMATVYLAHDVRHDRQVALKVLRPELAAIVGTERFLQEIRTTANLQHPHIVPLHDSGEIEGAVFYVMPYVEGESLRERLRRERQLPVNEAVRITCEAAAALDYAHRRGVIHRDIKPENILLHDERVLVADFGISLALSRADVGSRMTETGLSLGTPHYMSPEQASGERTLTARTDIYALGATLYEMLTGDPPFTGPTAQVVIAKALTESPAGIRDYRETVPEHVEAAVLTALRKLPADRFGTAAEFAEALRDEGRHVETAPRRPVPAARRRRWAAVLASLGAVAVLAGGVAIGYRLRPSEAPKPAPARVVIPLPAGQLVAQGAYPFDVAPDGSAIVYVADRDGQTQLVLRPLDAFERGARGNGRGAKPLLLR